MFSECCCILINVVYDVRLSVIQYTELQIGDITQSPSSNISPREESSDPRLVVLYFVEYFLLKKKVWFHWNMDMYYLKGLLWKLYVWSITWFTSRTDKSKLACYCKTASALCTILTTSKCLITCIDYQQCLINNVDYTEMFDKQCGCNGYRLLEFYLSESSLWR